MASEFVMPNWHVIFIHFPIALVITGVLIEVLTFAWRRSGFRAAGRWMMLLGALLAIPAATAGIYAFHSVVVSGQQDAGAHWEDIVRQSNWSPGQWEAIKDHIWLNSIASGIFVLSLIVWLGGSDNWRKKIYAPLLLAMIVGVGLIMAGAWHGGELVYRYGTGVVQGSAPAAVGHADDQPIGGLTICGRDIKYYIPPLELHFVLAGFVAAFVVAAFSLMLRRWYVDSFAVEPRVPERQPVAPAVVSEERPVSREERAQLRLRGEVPAKVYPSWFWLGAFLLAIGTAAAGAWAVLGVFTRETFEDNLKELQEPSARRLLVHVIFGVSIIVLSLILAGLVRFARRAKGLAGFLGVIVLLLIAGQVWLGVLMTYDGDDPSLIGFAKAASVAEPGEHGPQTKPQPGVGKTGGPASEPSIPQREPVPASRPSVTAPGQSVPPAPPPPPPVAQPSPLPSGVTGPAGAAPPATATPPGASVNPSEAGEPQQDQPAKQPEQAGDSAQHEEVGGNSGAVSQQGGSPGSTTHEAVGQ